MCQMAIYPSVILSQIHGVRFVPGIVEATLRKAHVWEGSRQVQLSQQTLQDAIKRSPQLVKDGRRLALSGEEALSDLWRACHCTESAWHLSKGTEPETAVECSFPRLTPAVQARHEGVGGISGLFGSIGSGNLSVLNTYFLDMLKARVSADDAVMEEARRLLWESKRRGTGLAYFVTHIAPAWYIVEEVFSSTSGTLYSSSTSVPEIYQNREGLRWTLAKTLLLMLNACRPAAGAVCRARRVQSAIGWSIVMAHAALDVLLLVTLLTLVHWFLDSRPIGDFLEKMMHLMQRYIYMLLKSLSGKDVDDIAATGHGAGEKIWPLLSQQEGFDFVEDASATIAPALAIASYQLARMAAGVFFFCA